MAALLFLESWLSGAAESHVRESSVLFVLQVRNEWRPQSSPGRFGIEWATIDLLLVCTAATP